MKTIKEVAVIFGVSNETIRRWIRDGKIKAIKVNKRLFRIEDSEIERLKKGE